MDFKDFLNSFREFLESSPEEALSDDSRYVFLSDLHMGDGSGRDDLAPNSGLIVGALERYLKRGFVLILGGDIEELQKFKSKSIRRAWPDLYGLFDAYAERGALLKMVGNHDLDLLRRDDNPYPLIHGLRLTRDGSTLFCFHGHQASRIFMEHSYISDFIVRYVAKPLKIRNTSISGDSRQRFKAERRIYRASKRLGIVSITGHTHRPLFESLSKYDSLRWSIEDLLREYPGAGDERRVRIAELVGVYRGEFERLSKKELRYGLSKSLYEEKSLLIPCLFNSGCATGKQGITAIEIEGPSISLVQFADEAGVRPYIAREALETDRSGGGRCVRFVLKRAAIEAVFSRNSLLGGSGGSVPGA